MTKDDSEKLAMHKLDICSRLDRIAEALEPPKATVEGYNESRRAEDQAAWDMFMAAALTGVAAANGSSIWTQFDSVAQQAELLADAALSARRQRQGRE